MLLVGIDAGVVAMEAIGAMWCWRLMRMLGCRSSFTINVVVATGAKGVGFGTDTGAVATEAKGVGLALMPVLLL